MTTPIKPGDMVEIISGSYSQFFAIVLAIDEQKRMAKVALRVFGHSPIWIELKALKHSEEDGAMDSSPRP